MLASPNGTAAKKDLHVGGVGAACANALSAVIDPLVDASETWVRRARDFVSRADDYVRDNPWAAVGVGAMLGLTLGYFVARRGAREEHRPCHTSALREQPTSEGRLPELPRLAHLPRRGSVAGRLCERRQGAQGRPRMAHRPGSPRPSLP